jgi:RNA polymerase sigma-70 factor, ECF subfamily
MKLGYDRLLAAARAGDEDAFRQLVAPLRSQLHVHCLRMLGSSHDAEDAVQEALLRAWRALPRFDGRAPIRAWLYRIATNVCLTALRRSDRLVPVDDPDALASTEFRDDTYDHDAGATTAVTAALRLPASQRAALILRDVLGYRAREAAAALGTTPASVNSALVRARANVDEQQYVAADRRLSDAVEGFDRGDVDALIGIAADPALSAERAWSYSAVPAY